MNSVMRAVLVAITAVATFYFVYWVGGSLFIPRDSPEWVPLVVSAVAAVAAATFVWRRPMESPGSSGSTPSLLRCISVGAIVTGAIGFSAGFFGPILFSPGANQGPLLGIFITGPLGFVLGALGGGVYWMARRKRSTQGVRDTAA